MTGYDGDELPTKPDATASAEVLMLGRLFARLPPIEAWFSADDEDRVRIEDLAVRLAQKR